MVYFGTQIKKVYNPSLFRRRGCRNVRPGWSNWILRQELENWKQGSQNYQTSSPSLGHPLLPMKLYLLVVPEASKTMHRLGTSIWANFTFKVNDQLSSVSFLEPLRASYPPVNSGRENSETRTTIKKRRLHFISKLTDRLQNGSDLSFKAGKWPWYLLVHLCHALSTSFRKGSLCGHPCGHLWGFSRVIGNAMRWRKLFWNPCLDGWEKIII